MTRPLYDHGLQGVRRALDGHPGLWYDRFFDGYPANWQPDLDKTSKSTWSTAKSGWINGMEGPVGDPAACEAAAKRVANLCADLGGETRNYATTWHFTTGLGNPHPVENGFLWHQTLGTPYIAGSAVKGLVRSWVEAWQEFPGENEPERQSLRLATLYRWFGSEDKNPRERRAKRLNGFKPPTRGQNLDTEVGALIFFDALPIAPVTLKPDVMTPHMGKWYENGGAIRSLKEYENIPADWHNPVPVFFLVADKPIFQFAVAPRTDAAKKELELVMPALDSALEWLGAGAKTAVGYGSMACRPPERLPDPIAEFRSWFEAQGFGATNKGRHGEIVERLGHLPDLQGGKAFVRTLMKKKDCTPRLWAFLNE